VPEKPKIIGRLSVIVAPGKRGDIVVRQGEESSKQLSVLVRNFVICYGLKKEMFSVIFKSLSDLVKNK